jgi:hypothetical protein
MKRIHCPIASRNGSNGGLISLMAESDRVVRICKGLVKRLWGFRAIDGVARRSPLGLRSRALPAPIDP